MKLGGVLLAAFGIIGVILVANGRWPNVWNAALGVTGNGSSSQNGVPGTTTNGTFIPDYGGYTGAQIGQTSGGG